MKRAEVIQNTKIYFNPWKTIYEGNPQMILDPRRGGFENGQGFYCPPVTRPGARQCKSEKRGTRRTDYIRNLGR